MSATRVITAREKSKIERQIEEASQKQEYRREPEDMDQFCVTVSWLFSIFRPSANCFRVHFCGLVTQ